MQANLPLTPTTAQATTTTTSSSEATKGQGQAPTPLQGLRESGLGPGLGNKLDTASSRLPHRGRARDRAHRGNRRHILTHHNDHHDHHKNNDNNNDNNDINDNYNEEKSNHDNDRRRSVLSSSPPLLQRQQQPQSRRASASASPVSAAAGITASGVQSGAGRWFAGADPLTPQQFSASVAVTVGTTTTTSTSTSNSNNGSGGGEGGGFSVTLAPGIYYLVAWAKVVTSLGRLLYYNLPPSTLILANMCMYVSCPPIPLFMPLFPVVTRWLCLYYLSPITHP